MSLPHPSTGCELCKTLSRIASFDDTTLKSKDPCVFLKVFLSHSSLARPITATALVDCGSTHDVISKKFSVSHTLPVQNLAFPREVESYSGAKTSLHQKASFYLNSDDTPTPFLVANLKDTYDLILGMPWMRKHGHRVNWRSKKLSHTKTIIDCLFETTNLDSFPPTDALAGPTIDVAKVSWNISAKLAAEKNAMEKSWEAAELVPEVYHDFLPTFEKSNLTKLPPHRPYDFRVELIDGANPQFSRPIPLSQAESAVLHEMITDGLKNGTLRRTQSPWAAPVLFTGKKDGKLRPCFDYRKLDALTVKNKYPLPLTMELVDSLLDADTFTSLDLRNGYNNLRVAEGHEYLLAFTCKEGQFEPLVMPFGPTGAPGFFQFFIQDIFRDRIGHDVAAYLDDILIYTKDDQDHTSAVRKALSTVRNNNLNLKPEKCKFSMKEIEYSLSSQKIRSEWIPRKLRQSVIGLPQKQSKKWKASLASVIFTEDSSMISQK